MKKRLLVGLVTGLFLAGMVGVASADVLDFEGLTTSLTASNYGGFNWDSSFAIVSDANFQSSYGNSYGSPSGEYAAFNAYGVLDVTMSGTEFDFTGAYFTGWAENNDFTSYTATTVTVTGYNGATQVGSQTMTLSADRYDWMQVDLLAVTSLKFTSSSIEQWWLMDDFTFNESSSVPEPATMLLFGTGLAGLVGLRRRKSKK